MDLKKNKTLVTAVVLFVVFGLVIAYVPLFFTPAPSPAPEPAAASLTPPVVEPEVAIATSTQGVSSGEEVSLPDSFSGLEEESESLDELLEGF